MSRHGDRRAPSHSEYSVVRAARDDAGEQDEPDAQLRAMRSVWLAMREEDPPDGGLVDLLAAARAKATALRARPTLRQRVLAVLRRPPALAFATVVVLVGGAMLFLGRGAGLRGELAAGSSGAVKPHAPPASAAKDAMPATVEVSASIELEDMYRKCEQAAARGDCATVRQMVSRIAKTDRDYRARVAKQAAVARCLADAAE